MKMFFLGFIIGIIVTSIVFIIFYTLDRYKRDKIYNDLKKEQSYMDY